jgi:hypothetical protein
MMDVNKILSNDVFVFEQYKNKTFNTLASDTIDDGTIQYKMNEHGYRSNSLYNTSEYNVITLGCSWTMGIGVDNNKIWPNLIGNKFGKVFNYGMYGVSTSFIAKTLYKIISTEFIPDMVLIMWPGFSRRDYIRENGSFKKVGGFRIANDNDLVWKNENEDLLFIELRNDYQDLMTFWEAYTFVETIAKLHNIKIFHTIAGYYYDVFKELEPQLKNTINYDTFFNPMDCYKNDLKGRDNHHPGEMWHENFSKQFYTYIKNKL